MKQLKSKNLFLIISLTVYVLSLSLPAITSNEFENKTLSGLTSLLMGSLAILGGGIYELLIWLANPLYFLSIILFFKSNNLAKFFSILATMLAFSLMTFKDILVSESGQKGKIDSFELGYWLWLLSFVILSVGIFYQSKKQS